MITDGIKNILGFTFKGRHSSEFNLATKTVKRVISPEQRTFDFKVSGRHGSIEYETGEYEDIYLEVEYNLIPSRDLKDFQEISQLAREMSEWITGSGKLVFDHEPDKYYEARVFSAIEAEYRQTGINILTGPLVFKCTPFAYSVKELNYRTEIEQKFPEVPKGQEKPKNPVAKTTYSNILPLQNKGSMPTMPLIRLINDGYNTITRIELEILKSGYNIPYDITNFKKEVINSDYVITGLTEIGLNKINFEGDLFVPAYTEYNIPIIRIEKEAFSQYDGSRVFNTNNVRHIEIEDGIEEVGDYAFSGMGYLKQSELVLPQSIKKVGAFAFNNTGRYQNSYEIKKFKLDLSNLYKLEIIEEQAFNMNNVTELLLPPNVKEIGYHGFDLNDLNPDDNTLNWSQYNKLEKIDTINCIHGTSKITVVTLPTSVREIGNIFCINMISINLPDLINLVSIKEIENTNLETLYFPGSLENIDKITSNSSLTTIDLSNTKITKTPSIYNNPKLKTIKYPKNIETLYSNSFNGYSTDKLDLSMYNFKTLGYDSLNDLIITDNPNVSPRERIILPVTLETIKHVYLKKDKIPANTEIDLRHLTNLKSIDSQAFNDLTIVMTQDQKNKFTKLDSSTNIIVE